MPDLARLLGQPEVTIRRHCARGEYGAFRVQGAWVASEAGLIAWERERRAETAHRRQQRGTALDVGTLVHRARRRAKAEKRGNPT